MKWLKEKGHTIYRSQGKFNISQGNFREHLSLPPFFFVCFVLFIFLVFWVVLLCVFTFLVPFCDFRYNFRKETMFGSSQPPVVCSDAHLFVL